MLIALSCFNGMIFIASRIIFRRDYISHVVVSAALIQHRQQWD